MEFKVFFPWDTSLFCSTTLVNILIGGFWRDLTRQTVKRCCFSAWGFIILTQYLYFVWTLLRNAHINNIWFGFGLACSANVQLPIRKKLWIYLLGCELITISNKRFHYYVYLSFIHYFILVVVVGCWLLYQFCG